jgi:hypothetical protein
MKLFEGTLENYSFSEVQRGHPQIQQMVYEAILKLTPAQASFLWDEYENEYQASVFQNFLDANTVSSIRFLLQELTEEKHLVVTTDDIIVTAKRLQELLFLHQGQKQGLVSVKLCEDKIEYYMEGNDDQTKPQSTIQPVKNRVTIHLSRNRYKYQVTSRP